MGWNTSSLFLCEIPHCQPARTPPGQTRPSSRGTCSLLPLKKQTLLPWNTCQPLAPPPPPLWPLLFSLSHNTLSYFYSLLSPLDVSCFPTSALSHKTVSLDVFVCHVASSAYLSGDRPCEKNNIGPSPLWHHFVFKSAYITSVHRVTVQKGWDNTQLAYFKV